jgi:hypothetical protein
MPDTITLMCEKCGKSHFLELDKAQGFDPLICLSCGHNNGSIEMAYAKAKGREKLVARKALADLLKSPR